MFFNQNAGRKFLGRIAGKDRHARLAKNRPSIQDVGHFMNATSRFGITRSAENTIVCFTSDNGGVSSGDAFCTSNLPLRGGKGRQWEGGIREPFNEDKMTAGLMKALEKRPVSIERVQEAVTKIKAALRATGEREIESRSVGELVMSQLRDLDEVAFVRFASVYRSFKDLDEFRQEIDRLSGEGDKSASE